VLNQQRKESRQHGKGRHMKLPLATELKSGSKAGDDGICCRSLHEATASTTAVLAIEEDYEAAIFSAFLYSQISSV
jgi:hypothetical protein